MSWGCRRSAPPLTTARSSAPCIVGNSNGWVVGDSLDSLERKALEGVARVTIVRHRLNAMGNNILANDSGAMVHPEFSNEVVAAIGRALGVPVDRGTVAGLATVGKAGIATNKGVVLHPKATEGEAAKVQELLKVPVHRSSANFGVPIVGACLIANSRGVLVGRPTTPVEVVHIQDGLGILDYRTRVAVEGPHAPADDRVLPIRARARNGSGAALSPEVSHGIPCDTVCKLLVGDRHLAVHHDAEVRELEDLLLVVGEIPAKFGRVVPDQFDRDTLDVRLADVAHAAERDPGLGYNRCRRTDRADGGPKDRSPSAHFPEG